MELIRDAIAITMATIGVVSFFQSTMHYPTFFFVDAEVKVGWHTFFSGLMLIMACTLIEKPSKNDTSAKSSMTRCCNLDTLEL
jgi:hypothetical protein